MPPFTRLRHVAFAISVLLALLSWAPTSVFAAITVVRTEPASSSVLAEAPPTFGVTFGGLLDATGSSAVVYDVDHKPIPGGTARVSEAVAEDD